MDTSAPWRALEVPQGDSDGAGRTAEGPRLSGHHLLLAAAALVAAASLAAVVLLESQRGGQVQVVAAAEATGPAASQVAIVVDVAGAVARPGVYSLPAGARVADAIGAAGGYSTDVDPRQAETQLNLAARLQDGEVIRVPRRGEVAAASGAVGGATVGGATVAGATAGLVNLNTASAEELDTLPGIGPVTAQKIISAREQQPFHSVDDLASRKIVSTTTLAKLRDRATI